MQANSHAYYYCFISYSFLIPKVAVYVLDICLKYEEKFGVEILLIAGECPSPFSATILGPGHLIITPY